MISLAQIPGLKPGVRLASDPVSLEPLLLYPEGFLFLNTTAYEVVRRCDGKTSVAQLIQSLNEEYDADPQTLREEIVGCLKELYDLRLMTTTEEGSQQTEE